MVKKMLFFLVKDKTIKRGVRRFMSCLKPSKIVYSPHLTSYVPYQCTLPSYVFYDNIESYLRNHSVMVPICITVPICTDKNIISWKMLLKYNRDLKLLQEKIITLEGRNFPERVWDNVAKTIVLVLQQQHKVRRSTCVI